MLNDEWKLFLSDIVDVYGSGSLIINDHFWKLHFSISQLFVQICILHCFHHEFQIFLKIFNIKIDNGFFVLLWKIILLTAFKFI